MSQRLSLVERNDLALELRHLILQRENVERLASIEDPYLQPHEVTVGIFAFEFFLDRYRKYFRGSMAEPIWYNLGWSKVSLLRDEQTRSVDRLIRMCTDLYILTIEERNQIAPVVERLKEVELGEFPPIDDEKLYLFFYEVLYEIAREAAHEIVEEKWRNRTGKD